MAPAVAPGEPRTAPKPQPSTMMDLPIVVLLMVCAFCGLFLLWRRASALRKVVAVQLQTWSHGEGRIRLSVDDGPPAREFLEDDYDDDNEGLADDEPLAVRAERLRASTGAVSSNGEHTDIPLLQNSDAQFPNRAVETVAA